MDLRALLTAFLRQGNGTGARFLGIIPLGSKLQARGATLKDRFLLEAAARWADYTILARKWHVSVHFSVVDRTGKKSPTHSRHECKQMEDSRALIIYQHLNLGDTQGILYCVNKRYAFKLTRSDSTAPWVITKLDEPPGDDYRLLTTRARQSTSWTVCRNLMLASVWLPDLIKARGFVLRSVNPATRAGRDLAEVEFDFRSEETADNPIRHGKLVLDPNNYWLPCSYEATAQWPDAEGKVSSTIEYLMDATAKGPTPVPRRCVVRYISSEAKVDDDLTYDLDVKTGNPVPESDFELAAFGLPDPALHYFNQPSQTSALEILPLRECVVPANPDKTQELTFVIRNHSAEPLQVLGGNFGCGANCCSRGLNLPLTVPARGEQEMRIGIRVGGAGSFHQRVSIFFVTDRPGVAALDIDGTAL
jgi:hypothetical protein